MPSFSIPASLNLSLFSIGSSELPGFISTLHIKQAAFPPQRVRIGTPARLAASRTVVPDFTFIVRSDGQNLTSQFIPATHLPVIHKMTISLSVGVALPVGLIHCYYPAGISFDDRLASQTEARIEFLRLQPVPFLIRDSFQPFAAFLHITAASCTSSLCAQMTPIDLRFDGQLQNRKPGHSLRFRRFRSSFKQNHAGIPSRIRFPIAAADPSSLCRRLKE